MDYQLIKKGGIQRVNKKEAKLKDFGRSSRHKP
jgi:hypothetical protein